MSARVFMYFKAYNDTEQSLTCPSEKLVETVGTSVTHSTFPKYNHITRQKFTSTIVIRFKILSKAYAE
jgi:hypothetical protein